MKYDHDTSKYFAIFQVAQKKQFHGSFFLKTLFYKVTIQKCFTESFILDSNSENVSFSVTSNQDESCKEENQRFVFVYSRSVTNLN